MTRYKILYWQEIPTQVRAEDEEDEVTLFLAANMERVDQVAMQRGFTQSEDYLAQWKWSEEQEREGSAEAVAEVVRASLESEWRQR